MTALDRLGQISNAYAKEAQAYEAVAVAAANAEAEVPAPRSSPQSPRGQGR